MAQDRFLVFEAINEKLKEIFVGISPLPMHLTIDRLRSKPPDIIKHWKMDDVGTFRSIEFDLSKDAALDFVREYTKGKLGGWHYLSEALKRTA